MLDIACGHGLIGVLFAVMEREVEHVVLIDKTQPLSFDATLAVLKAIAPWAEAKVRWNTCCCCLSCPIYMP
jgi:hypothetical protein